MTTPVVRKYEFLKPIAQIIKTRYKLAIECLITSFTCSMHTVANYVIGWSLHRQLWIGFRTFNYNKIA